jgi:hypothetical protein
MNSLPSFITKSSWKCPFNMLTEWDCELILKVRLSLCSSTATWTCMWKLCELHEPGAPTLHGSEWSVWRSGCFAPGKRAPGCEYEGFRNWFEMIILNKLTDDFLKWNSYDFLLLDGRNISTVFCSFVHAFVMTRTSYKLGALFKILLLTVVFQLLNTLADSKESLNEMKLLSLWAIGPVWTSVKLVNHNFQFFLSLERYFVYHVKHTRKLINSIKAEYDDSMLIIPYHNTGYDPE